MHTVPDELKYSSAHVWVEELDANKYRVGITDFAQSELGDIVFFEPPELEREFSQSDECAVVESVKSTSDIYCPLSGKIIEVNSALEDSPELINSEPYNEGWLFIIQTAGTPELNELMNAAEYEELTKEG